MSERIALVLAGGGITGVAFHSGALAALADAGWDARSADLIIGTSAGSMSGAMLRLGVPPADLLARAQGRMPSAATQALFTQVAPGGQPVVPEMRLPSDLRPADPAALWRALFRPPGRGQRAALLAAAVPAGTVDTTELIGEQFAALFPTWPKGYWAVAVRVSDGARVVFGRDREPPVPLAVAASCAIPGFFKPVEIDGARHVDGGVYSMANADLAAGADIVIVSSPLSIAGRNAGRPGPDLASRRLLRAQLDRQVRGLRRAGAHVLTLQPDGEMRRALGTNPMDPNQRARVGTTVYDAMARRLHHPNAKELLARLTA